MGCMLTSLKYQDDKPDRALRNIVIQPREQIPKEMPSELLFTEKSEVYLDGKLTKIEKIIPEETEIEKIDLAKDHKTILRVYFKKKKK